MNERTPYETDPVESVEQAIRAFVAAYNRLQAVPTKAGQDRTFSETLRLAMQRGVPLGGQLHMGLYEIGIAHAANGPAAMAALCIHEGKLARALAQRARDVQALFAREHDGLLPRLCALLETETDLPGEGMRLLNECRRLMAFWG